MAMQFGANQGPPGVDIVHPDRNGPAAAYIAQGLPQVFPNGPPSAEARAFATTAIAGVGRPEPTAWTPDGGALSNVRSALRAGGVGAAISAATQATMGQLGNDSAAQVPVTRPRIRNVRQSEGPHALG